VAAGRGTLPHHAARPTGSPRAPATICCWSARNSVRPFLSQGASKMTVRMAKNRQVQRCSLRENAEGIAKITINRPEVRNAFRPLTIQEMSHAFADARDDGERRCGDLDGRRPGRRSAPAATNACAAPAATSAMTGWRGSTCSICSGKSARCPSPWSRWWPVTPSAAATFCILICDLTIAAENARFGQTGPKVGSFDGGYGSSYLARIVGQKKAREIWFLCRQYDARQALAMGLVNHVVPDAGSKRRPSAGAARFCSTARWRCAASSQR
jgi:hypothetical protein